MIQKCDNPNCKKQIDVPNWKLERYINFYCCRACKDSAQTKYTQDVKDFIERNIDNYSIATLARKYGFTQSNLKWHMNVWRREKKLNNQNTTT